jgi:hypothetical protein
MKPDKVTYEGYVETGFLDLPPIDDDDEQVVLEPSIVEEEDDPSPEK